MDEAGAFGAWPAEDGADEEDDGTVTVFAGTTFAGAGFAGAGLEAEEEADAEAGAFTVGAPVPAAALDGCDVEAPDEAEDDDESGATGKPASGRSARDGAADEIDAAADDAGREDVSTVGSLPAGRVEVSTLAVADSLLFSRLPTTVMASEQMKKATARIPVMRVSKLPAPRADMKPEGPPPMPSAPPSERWIRTRPPMLMQMMIWT